MTIIRKCRMYTLVYFTVNCNCCLSCADITTASMHFITAYNCIRYNQLYLQTVDKWLCVYHICRIMGDLLLQPINYDKCIVY